MVWMVAVLNAWVGASVNDFQPLSASLVVSLSLQTFNWLIALK